MAEEVARQEIEITPQMIAAGVECAEDELANMERPIPRLLLEILVERCVRASLAAGGQPDPAA